MNARLRGDRGQLAGIEVLPFGFLVFVSLTLLIVNLWGVIDTRMAISSASREAVRAYVESPTAAEADRAARQRAQETLRALGRDDTRATIEIIVGPRGFARCSRVAVTVGYTVPGLAVPFLGGFRNGFRLSSTSSEIVDPFRDGVPGTADCPW